MAASESAITISVGESFSDVHLTIPSDWKSQRSFGAGWKTGGGAAVRMFALTASAEADSSGRWTTYVGGPSH